VAAAAHGENALAAAESGPARERVLAGRTAAGCPSCGGRPAASRTRQKKCSCRKGHQRSRKGVAMGSVKGVATGGLTSLSSINHRCAKGATLLAALHQVRGGPAGIRSTMRSQLSGSGTYVLTENP
jgi:hypothetical protein